MNADLVQGGEGDMFMKQVNQLAQDLLLVEDEAMERVRHMKGLSTSTIPVITMNMRCNDHAIF